jgi:hypothetical protein
MLKRHILDCAAVIAFLLASFLFSMIGPQQDSMPPSEVFLSLPDDTSSFRCPAGYTDPEFAGDRIVCHWDAPEISEQ